MKHTKGYDRYMEHTKGYDLYMEHNKDYHRGYIAAIKDFEEEQFDIDVALYLFAMDSVNRDASLYDKDGNLPSNDYQEGYHDALLSIKKYGKPVYTSDNVTYVGFQCI